MLKKSFILLWGTTLILQACSNSSPTQKAPSLPTPLNTEANTEALPQEGIGSFSTTYEFTGEALCSTGEQIIKATSAEELTKSLCQSLQNGGVNNHCAETKRLQLFIEKCQNQKWEPTATISGIQELRDRREKYEIEVNANRKNWASFPSQIISESLMSDVKYAVSTFEITKDLDPSNQIIAEQVKDYMENYSVVPLVPFKRESPPVTIEFNGVILNYPPSASLYEDNPVQEKCRWPRQHGRIYYSTVFWPSRGEYAAIEEVELQKGPYLILVYIFGSNHSALEATIEIYRSYYSRGYRSYSDYLSDPNSTQLLATATTQPSLSCPANSH